MKVTVEVTIDEECHRRCPRHKRLSVRISQLAQGAFFTMTTGTPISVTFPTKLTQGQPVTISAVDENGASIPPVGLTFVSDSPAVTVTVDATDPNTFWLMGVVGSPGTANVTFTDSTGDTVVVGCTTTELPPSITLIATAGAPV